MSPHTLDQWQRRLIPVLILISIGLALSPQPAVASSPTSLIISNVRDTSFAVSWLTSTGENGSVQIVGGNTANDVRGPGYAGLTHYVTANGLLPNSRYEFDIMSGGEKSDNGGAHFVVTTGPALTPPTPDLVVGRVKHSDGMTATDAIVIFTIQQDERVSAPVSMLLTQSDGGFFHVNLSDARVQGDPSRYFTYGGTADLLTIQAADARGTGVTRVAVSDPRLRASDPDQTLVVQLSSPSEATPTLILRLPTPTPVPAYSPHQSQELVVTVGTLALVAFGIAIVAFLFVWRR